MQIGTYVGLTIESEAVLQSAYLNAATRHKRDAGIRDGSRRAVRFTELRMNAANDLGKRFGATSSRDPKLVRNALFHGLRPGGLGLLRDLHDLALLANQSLLYWTGLSQGCKALHDEHAVKICRQSIDALQLEIDWLKTELKNAAPQVLTISTPRRKQIISIVQKLPTAAFSERRGPQVLKAAAVTTAGLLGFLAGRRCSA
jgi:hypothetical protein